MRFGLTLCNHGQYADPSLLADLAVRAEEAGWDGVFVWDHVARDDDPPMVDPWIVLAAIATRTSRVTIGPMVTPLARRRPWKLAREVTTLDLLSGGRLVLGVGLGVHPEEFEQVGDEPDPRRRAALLDESLELLTALWSGEPVHHEGEAYDVRAWQRPRPAQRPRVPIWVGGTWPNRPPMRRAARWDGVFPARPTPYEPDDYREMRAYIDEHRTDPDALFTVVHQGTGVDGDLDRWRDYEQAGVDWWLESFKDELRDVDACRAVIDAGPPGSADDPRNENPTAA